MSESIRRFAPVRHASPWGSPPADIPLRREELRHPASCPGWFIQDAVAVVAAGMGRKTETFWARDHRRQAVWARHIVWAIARLGGPEPISFPEIARWSHRDHSTVSSGVERIAVMVRYHRDLCPQIDAFCADLRMAGWRVNTIVGRLMDYFGGKRERPMTMADRAAAALPDTYATTRRVYDAIRAHADIPISYQSAYQALRTLRRKGIAEISPYRIDGQAAWRRCR